MDLRGVWVPVDKVNNHFVNTVKYEPLRGSPYIKLRQSCDITTRA